MGSKYQYRLSQKAEADLDSIISYIAVELSDPKAASIFISIAVFSDAEPAWILPATFYAYKQCIH